MAADEIKKINVEEIKKKIIEIINSKGPSLPSKISKEITLSPLFTSAILSEMGHSKLLKISHLKIGSSPLYYLEGQEQLLENFSNFLQNKEREAFDLLIKKKILVDGELEPAHRVALRSIKDFAVPIKAFVENEEKIFWKFHSLSKEDALKKINELVSKSRKKLREKPEKKETEAGKKKEEKVEKAKEKKELDIFEKPRKPEEKAEKEVKSELLERLYDYAKKNSIEILEKIELKKKEAYLKVVLNSSIGKLDYLLVMKDKKTINEADLILALQKGQTFKLPILFVTNGKISKKANIENFKNQLILRQM